MLFFNEIILVLASTQLKKQFSALTLEAIGCLRGLVVLSGEQSWVNTPGLLAVWWAWEQGQRFHGGEHFYKGEPDNEPD